MGQWKGKRSSLVVRKEASEKEEGRGVKRWEKKVGILQQSGWCEGGGVRNAAGNARAGSMCNKPHCNISHP